MQVPLAGAIVGSVRSVKTASIHGDMYLDVLLEPEGASAEPGKVAVLPIRIASHALPGGAALAVGAKVEVTFLMRQVTGVRVV